MIEFVLLYIAFMFGINNSGLINGSLMAAGFSYKKAVIITTIGFGLGFIIEGSKMQMVLSQISDIDLTIQFIITSIVFTIFLLIGLPISMVNVLLGSHVGVALASNATININNLFNIIISWLVTPFIAIITSILFYILFGIILQRFSLLSIYKFYTITIPILMFYAAYVLAANNMGLLWNSKLFMLLPFAMTVGVINGRRSAILVNEEIIGHSQASVFSALLASSLLLWIFTQLTIPISLSQLLLASLIGSSLYRKPRIYNKTNMLILVISWICSTILSIILAYYATFLLGSL